LQLVLAVIATKAARNGKSGSKLASTGLNAVSDILKNGWNNSYLTVGHYNSHLTVMPDIVGPQTA
jgi:hypothetical protein